MAVQRIRSPQQPGIPTDLPENVPVTFETTYTKRVGSDAADTVADTIEDYRHATWVVYRYGPNGWGEKGTETGRPHAYRLRAIHGPGRYKCVPVDQSGDPVERLAVTEVVEGVEEPVAPVAVAPAAPQDDLPPFMRMILAQQAEERAEARRAAAASEARREQWEREQRTREWERAEREERAERQRAERESEERRLAAERSDKLIQAGITLAGSLMSSVSTVMAAARTGGEARANPLNESLLTAVLQQSRPQGGGIKETLEMLLVLDQVAQSRADRAAPPPAPEREEKDEGLLDSLKGLLPVLIAMRGGSAPQAAASAQALERPGADAGAIAEQTVQSILRDPVALSELASRDPDGTARVFLAAVQRNPALQASVAKVFTEAQS